MPLKGILFDLDGTLVDTAPDLCGTIQDMQSDRGVDITPYRAMEHLASGGARALLKAGFGLMALLFALNTAGNLLAVNPLEKIIFTPLTLLLALLSFRLVLTAAPQPANATIPQ